jgi:hypothetical protein
MSRQELVPTPLDVVAQMWAWPVAVSTLFIRSFNPLDTDRRWRKPKLKARRRKAPHDPSRLTPKEEFLLLHLLD